MPWYTDLKSEKEYSAFVTFLQDMKDTYGFDWTGVGTKKSTSALLGAWGCTYALEGKPPPNPYVMFTFNSLKAKGKELVNTHILLAEFMLGFCKSGPLANQGIEVQKFLRVNPILGDRSYEHYKLALEAAARNGVNIQAAFREVIGMRSILVQLFEAPWVAFVESRLKQFQSERSEVSLLALGIQDGLAQLRKKMKAKIEGSGLFKGSLEGQFLLIHEAKDGAPILLVSDHFGKALSEKYRSEAKTLMSTKCDKTATGYWRQTGNRKSLYFATTESTGGLTKETFVLALLKMGVQRTVSLKQPSELGIGN